MFTKIQLTLILALLTQACGKDDGDSAPAPDAQRQVATDQQPSNYSMAVTAMADLPTCDDAHNQQLVYVIDAKQFHTCQAGKWVEIAVQMKDEPADPKAVQNALASIELGAKWDGIPALAKDALTGGESKVTDFTNSVCAGRVEKSYTLGGYDFDFDLHVYNGVIVSLWPKGSAAGSGQHVPCS